MDARMSGDRGKTPHRKGGQQKDVLKRTGDWSQKLTPLEMTNQISHGPIYPVWFAIRRLLNGGRHGKALGDSCC